MVHSGVRGSCVIAPPRLDAAPLARSTRAGMRSSNVTPRAGRGAKIGRVELHVLCSGTWDAAPSLLLTVERKETHGYLINCGEGTMRFCAEHHMKLTPHLTRVLFTRQTWDVIGGLPDVLLTRFAEREKYSDKVDVCRAKVHGLSRLPQLIGSFHDFVRREALPQEVTESPDQWPDSEGRCFEESGLQAGDILTVAILTVAASRRAGCRHI